jgi:hypothetical protein
MIEARLTEAEAEARVGRYDRAFAAIESVVEMARSSGTELDPKTLERRDELAREELKARLEAVGAGSPRIALGECLTLRERVRLDPALTALGPSVEGRLARIRVRVAEEELADAERSLSAGQFEQALSQAARSREQAELSADHSTRVVSVVTRIDAVAERVARERGVVVDPISARLLLGTLNECDRDLLRPAVAALEARGFITTPQPAAWAPIWTRAAGSRLILRVDEELIPYLQSANRASRLNARLDLIRDGRSAWSATVSGHTRIPPRGITAYEASLIAASAHRAPAAEHRLHEDAWAMLRERLASALKGVPSP